MTFAGAPLSLLVPAFGAGSAVVGALYLLKLRRRRVEVPFAALWRRVLRDTESTALWRKLRRLLSLALQLTVLLLILGAIGDPRLSTSARGRAVAILIDTSASMQALDGPGGQPRLEQAKSEARRVIRGLSGDDIAMVVGLDARSSPLTGFDADEASLLRAVDALAASDAPAGLERGLRLCADALAGRAHPTLVLIGDGAYDPRLLERIRTRPPTAGGRDLQAIDLYGIDMRFIPVGRSGDNVGIVAFAVRRYPANHTAYEVLLELVSFRSTPASLRLELLQDDQVVNVERIELAPGQHLQRLYPNLSGRGRHLEARLRLEPDGRRAAEHLDVFALDDHAYAVLPAGKRQKVLLVSKGNLFLEGALLLNPDLEVTRLDPAAYRAADTARYDAVILDAVTPEEPPRTHALYLDPRGPASPFPVRGELQAPLVTEVASRHPLMRWVELGDLNLSRASRFQLRPGDVRVASALRDVIMVARETDGRKSAAIGFDLRESDLPLRVAFPVLVVNALDWFGGDDAAAPASYATGDNWRLAVAPGAAEVTVRAPDGQLTRLPVHEGRVNYSGRRVGYYTVATAGAPDSLLAANLQSAAESRIEPRSRLMIEGRTLERPSAGRLGLKRQLWPYLIMLALGLAVLEWWTYHRRITV